MKSKTSLLFAGVLATALIFGAALAQDAKPGADEWVAPTRAAKKKNPIEATEASLAKGKTVWVKECASLSPISST